MKAKLLLVIDCDPSRTAPERAQHDRPSGLSYERCRNYRLAIDGPLLKSQRQWLATIRETVAGAVRDGDYRIRVDAEDLGLLDGLIALADTIADQAHDRYGPDCLLEDAGPPTA